MCRTQDFGCLRNGLDLADLRYHAGTTRVAAIPAMAPFAVVDPEGAVVDGGLILSISDVEPGS